MNREKLESTGEGRTVLIGKGAGEKISVPQSKGMKPFTKIFSGSRNTAIGTMALGL